MATFKVQKNSNYTVMSNHHLRDKRLTNSERGLLSLMLSLPEDWDYTVNGLAYICNETQHSIRKDVQGLEKAGYLKRKRVRDEQGKLRGTEYWVYEEPQLADEQSEQPEEKAVKASCKKQTQESREPKKPENKPFSPNCEKPTLVLPTLVNRTQINKDIISKDIINKESNLVISEQTGQDEIELREETRSVIEDNIDYEVLTEEYGEAEVDELVDLMVDTVCTKREEVRVAREDIPAEVVKARLMKIHEGHIRYVLDRMSSNTTKVHNIKAYLLTALYNAPITIDSYYRAEVNHDLYGGFG